MNLIVLLPKNVPPSRASDNRKSRDYGKVSFHICCLVREYFKVIPSIIFDNTTKWFQGSALDIYVLGDIIHIHANELIAADCSDDCKLVCSRDGCSTNATQ